MTQLLDIQDLSISHQFEYNSYKTLVNKVSFSIDQGKTLAIVGESGSGKSLTAMSILRLLPLNDMKITSTTSRYTKNAHQAIDLHHISASQLPTIRGREIAFIPQDPLTSLNPVQKIGKQIIEVFKLHRKDIQPKDYTQQAIALITQVKLKHPEIVINSYPHKLSGGMRQRVMIAIALAANPKLLIADEPTTSLDVTTQKEILMLIRSLQKRYNMGLLFISHDLGLVKFLADDIAVMYQGNIVEYNHSQQIIENPQHKYTQKLIAASHYQKQTKNTKTNDQSKSDQQVASQPCNHEMSNEQTILSVNSVSQAYNTKRYLFKKNLLDHQVLDQVSFDVYRNEILAIVGESGSGKSTLARLITALEKPTQGSVIYQNQIISELSYKQLITIKQSIQIVLQDPSAVLNERFTIEKVLKEPLIIHGITDQQKQQQRINNILNHVELENDIKYRYPHQLSGGQRQRVAIARSLILSPSILVLDEPLSALDVILQQQIIKLLKHLKKTLSLTIVLISHDLNLVKHFSDRTLVLNQGKVAEIQTTKELFSQPKSSYTQGLLASHQFE